MALQVTQRPTQAGVVPAFSAVSASDTLVPADDVFLYVKNGNAASCTVTVVAVTACNQGSLHNLVVVIPTLTDRLIGPIKPSQFAAVANGLATVTYSVVPTVTAAVIESA